MSSFPPETVISAVRRICLVCGLMLPFIILRSSLKSAISIQSASSVKMELYDTEDASAVLLQKSSILMAV